MTRLPSLQLPTDSVGVQTRKKGEWNAFRRGESADFYTFGYAGRSTYDVLDALETAGIATVVDIRHMAVSMYRPDFSKQNFRRLLAERGIEYIHLPDMGIPRDVRGLASGQATRDLLWDWYDANVAEEFGARNLTRFFNSADHPLAFMCVELDPTSCHRHRLCLALESQGLRGFDL